MKATKVLLLIGILLSCIALFLCACGSTASEGSAPSTETATESTPAADSGSTSAATAAHKADDTIVIALPFDIASLDPYAQNATLQNALSYCIYNTLTSTDLATGELSLELAESYEQVSDTEYLFYLRKDIKFHNGADFTASDVKFSIERAATSGGMAAKVSMIDHVEVVDDYTVKFVLKYPCVTLLNVLSFTAASMLDEDFVTANGDSYQPNGTGPYKFREWNSGESIILDRNEEYWDKPGGAAVLKFVIMTEDTSRTIALETGDIDVSITVAAVDYDKLKANEDLVLYADTNNKVDYLGLSHIDPITSSLKVRQAIAHAINKEDYIVAVLEGNGETANSIMGKSVEGYNPDLPEYEYDLEKAKALLAEAGYPDGFELTVTARSDRDNLLSQVLQGQLAKVGITVKIERVETAVFFDKCAAGQIQASFGNWAGMTSDADNPLRGLLFSGNAGTNNRTWYQNEQLDKLLNEGISISDQAERIKVYHEIQDLIYEDVALIPLFCELQANAANKDVGGVFIPKIGDAMPYWSYYWK